MASPVGKDPSGQDLPGRDLPGHDLPGHEHSRQKSASGQPHTPVQQPASVQPRTPIRLLSPVHPIQLAIGLTIWSMWFIAVYAGLSIACSVAPPPEASGSRTWVNISLLGLTLVTTALLLVCALRCWRAQAPSGNRRFVTRVAAGGYSIAAVATLAVGLPILLLPPCV